MARADHEQHREPAHVQPANVLAALASAQQLRAQPFDAIEIRVSELFGDDDNDEA